MNYNKPTRIRSAAAFSLAVLGGAAVLTAGAAAVRNREYRDIAANVPAAVRGQNLAIKAGAPASSPVSLASAVKVATQDSKDGEPAVASTPESEAQAQQDDVRIAYVVGQLLAKRHYLKHPLDRTMSNRLFDRYLDALDPQHEYFTQADIAEWAPMRDKLAIMINESGDTSFAGVVFKRFTERFDQRVAFIEDASKNRKFDFTGSDYYTLDRHDAARPADMEAAKDLWWKHLRADYLQELLANTPTPGGPPSNVKNQPKPKTPQAILDTLHHRYLRAQRNYKEMSGDDVFAAYLDQLALAYDPHTDYFGKRSTADFKTSMQLSLFGIGAQLLPSDEGYVKIMMLTAGGPAIKSKKLAVGDQITAVGQGTDGEWVDTRDMNVNKVVDMIRGPKGTTVRLTVMPSGAPDPSTRKQITLVRDEIRLEDQAAKARVIDLPDTKGKTNRIGIIALPSFYGGGDNGRSCEDDVRRLLEKLKQEKVSGVVLDLRNNPGGALDEAIKLTGLFIKTGPVVQVALADGRHEVESDTDDSVIWGGPLVVLTSRTCASASEILSGALRDYGRAVILGDDQTFGKGTVQSVYDLQTWMQQLNLPVSSDPGSIHLTVQKFYLPSGASTQRKGVPSDLIIPSRTQVYTDWEKSKDNALPFDTIPPAKYDHLNQVKPYLAELKKRSATRVASNQLFAFLKDDISRFEVSQKQNRLSMNEAQRLKERHEAEARLAMRQKVVASLNASLHEKVYPITLADVDKPGLPHPLKPLLASNSKSLASVSGSDDSDDSDASADSSAANDRDITLDESEKVLIDYIGLLSGHK